MIRTTGIDWAIPQANTGPVQDIALAVCDDAIATDRPAAIVVQPNHLLLVPRQDRLMFDQCLGMVL